MACAKISRKQRLIATIAISFSFFVAELIGEFRFRAGRVCLLRREPAGFYTHSLALVADAFHYVRVVCAREAMLTITDILQLSDLAGFVVALVAVVV